MGQKRRIQVRHFYMSVRFGQTLVINGVEQESIPPSRAEFRLQFCFGFEPVLKGRAAGAPACLPFEKGPPRNRIV
jgi:hypothetical protein